MLRTQANYTGNWFNPLDTCVLFPLTYPVWLPNSEANKFTKYANSLTRFIPVLTSPPQVNGEVKRQNTFVLCYFVIDYMKFKRRTWELTVPTDTHLSEVRKCILVYKSQQDAQVTEFILSENCSTCFGFHYHPSSGAQNNCNYSIW